MSMATILLRLLLAFIAALAPSARAQVAAAPAAFEARLAVLAQEAVPPLDAVLEALRDARDVPGQLAALAELGRRAGGLDAVGRHQVAAALREAAASSFNAGTVRGRALEALGRASAWQDDATRADAVRTLIDYASADGPADSRAGLHIYAMRALSEAAGRLPAEGDALREAVAGCALDGLRRAASDADRLSALMLFDAFLRGNGPGVFLRSWDLRSRLEAEVFAPLEGGGLDRLYDQPQATLDARFFLIRSLAVLGRAYGGGDLTLPQRALGILRQMAQREPDPRLRQLAELYSRRP